MYNLIIFIFKFFLGYCLFFYFGSGSLNYIDFIIRKELFLCLDFFLEDILFYLMKVYISFFICIVKFFMFIFVV